MLSAKQGNYWYHFNRLWYDAVLDWGLNPGPSALDASTLRLGYRGDGVCLLTLVLATAANHRDILR